MTFDPNCPFCTIAQGNEPGTREVYRDDQTVAFFPKEPATLGHTLVVPTKHMATIWDVDTNTAQALTNTVHRICLAAREALNPEGLNIIQSNGDAATQTVPHLHVHVVPRWTGDAIGNIWPPSPYLSDEAKDRAALRIRSATQRHDTN